MTEINSPNSLVPVIPFGPGETEIHLEDDDGNAVVVSSLEELVRDTVDLNNAQFNIENSNNVVVGPYFSGLTVHQHFVGLPEQIQALSNNNNNSNADQSQTNNNAKLVKLESPDQSNGKFIKIRNKFKVLTITFTIFLIILIVVITAVLLSRKNNNNIDNFDYQMSTVPTTTTASTIPDTMYGTQLGNHEVIYRDRWLGHNPLNFTKKLVHPVPWVIISHTVTIFCKQKSVCMSQMRNMQDAHMNNGSPDIGYNFLIGGDNNIYVGRGWDIVNFHGNNTIGIAYIGNFVTDELTTGMIDATKKLLEQGLKLKKLNLNYTILCHNQTYNTLSPGKNVYKIVETWPHYSNATVDFTDF